jgi:serine/threonine protein kinase
VTLFVLVTGCLPFKMAVPNDSLYQYFVKSDYVEFWRKRNVNVSPFFMELFDNMVAFDYSQRPSISEIRESPWMKEINWDLLPYLKQEFILRENKIKNNQEKSNKMMKKEIITKNEQPIFSLLQTKKYIRNIKFNNEKSINNIDENENNQINNNIKSSDSDKKTDEENKGVIRLKSKAKNLNAILIKIKKYLKQKGYVPNYHDFNKCEIEVTDGEVDILLKIERNKMGIIKLKYFKLKGIFDKFKLFKNEIDLYKAKYC